MKKAPIKECVHCFYGDWNQGKLQLWMWLAELDYNFEWDWLIELSDNKLSANNLTSELVENRSFLNQTS